jgi:hypothetical protein
LAANVTKDVDEDQRLERQWEKVQVAEFLRLVQDNQRILDTSLAEDQALRQQRHRLREAKLAQLTGLPVRSDPIPFLAESAMGDIKIDSPETHNHYPQTPSVSPTGLITKAALATALAAAAGLGGWSLNQFLSKPPAPASTHTETWEGLRLELVGPDGTPSKP